VAWRSCEPAFPAHWGHSCFLSLETNHRACHRAPKIHPDARILRCEGIGHRHPHGVGGLAILSSPVFRLARARSSRVSHRISSPQRRITAIPHIPRLVLVAFSQPKHSSLRVRFILSAKNPKAAYFRSRFKKVSTIDWTGEASGALMALTCPIHE
jgi:hypothetical protein